MFYWLLAVLVLIVAILYWRNQARRNSEERERSERRARTDALLSKVLLGEGATIGRNTRNPSGTISRPLPSPLERRLPFVPAPEAPVDVEMLLKDEPEVVAQRARELLDRPTNVPSDTQAASTMANTTRSARSPLSLQSGDIDVPLDSLTIAWFEARGYITRAAPDDAAPIKALLRHRDDEKRNYAFVHDRGRLTAQRAAGLLEKARGAGMTRLLVAAEHGADPAVNSARLRDVQVIDWIALDREMKRIDFRVAAKIIAIARERAHA
jgi:hypothetical protein